MSFIEDDLVWFVRAMFCRPDEMKLEYSMREKGLRLRRTSTYRGGQMARNKGKFFSAMASMRSSREHGYVPGLCVPDLRVLTGSNMDVSNPSHTRRCKGKETHIVGHVRTAETWTIDPYYYYYLTNFRVPGTNISQNCPRLNYQTECYGMATDPSRSLWSPSPG